MMIADNIKQVQETIATACAKVNRATSDITLVAISKRKPIAAIVEAVKAGVQHFGENRVEEATSKLEMPFTDQTLIWHFVGHIQSRKARDVVPLFDVIHSVDSLKLAQKLSTLMDEQTSKNSIDIFLQVNISGEDTKSGFNAQQWAKNQQIKDELWHNVQLIHALPGLNLRGLMTMAPIVEDIEQARPVFAGLAELRASLSESLHIPLPDLSMGMTDDYSVAIEEGATLVRVGRAIFGERV